MKIELPKNYTFEDVGSILLSKEYQPYLLTHSVYCCGKVVSIMQDNCQYVSQAPDDNFTNALPCSLPWHAGTWVGWSIYIDPHMAWNDNNIYLIPRTFYCVSLYNKLIEKHKKLLSKDWKRISTFCKHLTNELSKDIKDINESYNLAISIKIPDSKDLRKHLEEVGISVQDVKTNVLKIACHECVYKLFEKLKNDEK